MHVNEKTQRWLFLYTPMIIVIILFSSIFFIPYDNIARRYWIKHFSTHKSKLYELSGYILEKKNYSLSWEEIYNKNGRKNDTVLNEMLKKLPIERIEIDDHRTHLQDKKSKIDIYYQLKSGLPVFYEYYYVFFTINSDDHATRNNYTLDKLDEHFWLYIDQNN